MKAIGGESQKKYYKHIQEAWVQPTCVQSSAYGGSQFVADNSSGGMDGAGWYWGSAAGSFNGSDGRGLHKNDGNMLSRLWCYVPEPIKVTKFTINAGYFYNSHIYCSNGWGGTDVLLANPGGVNGTYTVDITMNDYKQFFMFYFWYPANYNSTTNSIKFHAVTKPKLVETTEDDAEFSIDYSGIKVRYADNKYYGL